MLLFNGGRMNQTIKEQTITLIDAQKLFANLTD